MELTNILSIHTKRKLTVHKKTQVSISCCWDHNRTWMTANIRWNPEIRDVSECRKTRHMQPLLFQTEIFRSDCWDRSSRNRNAEWPTDLQRSSIERTSPLSEKQTSAEKEELTRSRDRWECFVTDDDRHYRRITRNNIRRNPLIVKYRRATDKCRNNLLMTVWERLLKV